MTKPTVEAPQRWVDAPNADGDGLEGALFRAVPPAEPLSAAALSLVHARLGTGRRTSPVQRRLREAVLAGVMLLAGSSLALAGWGVTEWWSARREPALARTTPGVSTVAPKQTRARRAAAVPLQTAAPSASAALPEPAPSEPEEVAVPRTANAKEPDRHAGNADESELAAESLALQHVLVKLRREHDASGALALLDQSQALFEHGALALEAQVARVDALLLLGRQTEALAILNQLPLTHLGRAGELRLQRAELRAHTDCGLALADFDVLTRQALAPALAERALYGRAGCELRVGDDSHAQSDLREYLTRFPSGRFSAEARQQLGRMSQK